MNVRDIRKFAKKQLKGNYTALIGDLVLIFITSVLFVGAFFILYLLGLVAVHQQAKNAALHPMMSTVILSLFGIIAAAMLVLFLYVMIGYSRGLTLMYLHIASGHKESAFHIFRGFHKDGNGFKNYAGTFGILLGIGLVLVIPEIVIGLIYGFSSRNYRVTGDIISIIDVIISLFLCLAAYASAHQPEMKPMQCIRFSIYLMRNRKWKYMRLILSFVGWILLCIVTLGLASFYVIPYMQEAQTVFYLEATANEFRKSVASSNANDANSVRENSATTTRTEEAGQTEPASWTEHSEQTETPERDATERTEASTWSGESSRTESVKPAQSADRYMEVPYEQGEMTTAGTTAPVETRQRYRSEDDAMRAYEQWKKDHGITIDNNLGDIQTGENEHHPEIR